jgi:hypothetical protein
MSDLALARARRTSRSLPQLGFSIDCGGTFFLPA